MTNLDDYVNQTEAAEILGRDGSTVSRWSDQGKLLVRHRVGYVKLYSRADVEALRDQLAADKAQASA